MSIPYSPQHRWMEWLVDVQVASRGCGSPVCLHTSRLGTAVPGHNSPTTLLWEDEKSDRMKNLAVIYTVISTRSHDKKRQELFCAKMKKVREWWLFGGCKIHCRMMMYVASSTRSQLANHSSVRGWKKWVDENLALIYTVISTRSHDKK